MITETHEALEQQTATAEVLQVINSSPGDLAPVFDAVLEKASRLHDAAFGILSSISDSGIVSHRAFYGTPALAEVYGKRAPSRAPVGGVLDRLINGERCPQVDDATEGDLYLHDERRRVVELAGARTIISVGLYKDDLLVGAISLYRREVRRFSEREIAVLEGFAAQAVIAMENARLITETQEALQQQTATAEVLGVINSSPGDLAPVFDAMVDKAMRLCDAAQGSLYTLADGALHLVAIHASPELVALRQQDGPYRPQPGTPFYPLLTGERVVHFADVRESPAYREFPATRERMDATSARSFLAVALHKDQTPIGVLSVFRQEVRPFTDKQIALLETFAAQAVIAMENARLITETREALEQQTATAEVLGVINASPGNLTPVFDAILDRALSRCEAAFGFMTTYDGDVFVPCALHDVPEALANYFAKGMDHPQPGDAHWQLLQGAELVHNIDQKDDEAYRSGSPLRRAVVDLGGTRTALVVALRKDDVLRGTLTLYRQEVRPFTDKQIALVQNFAAQAVIAMENARLITETREALEQQTATAEVLGVINASPGDLAPVFEAMLEKAMRLCDASFGQLVTSSDGELFTVAAAQGPPAIVEFLRNRPPNRPGPGTSMKRLIGGERCVHIHDAKADEAYQRGDPMRRALVDLGGCRTLVSVGLRKDDVLLGAINVYRSEVRPFSTTEVALIENFAAQAVIAMENARLLDELRQRTDQVAELNRGLEVRVAEQVEELGRVGRLKRFLAPQLAEMIVSQGDEKILESHRREIVVVFCDLRGYTAFTETAEPEEVLDFLREYHGALGPLVSQFEGTLDQFSGDGIMVFFNDPVPIPDPAERAVKMAVAMRNAAAALIADWRERGRDLGFGAGIAQGYATLGQIGFSERSGYTAIGTVCNVAARLCAEAKDGQILLSQRVNVALKGGIATEQVGALTLKGLTQPVVAYNVPLATVQPALRVIEGGPAQSI